MNWLEEKLRPPISPEPWRRDLVGMGLLAVLGIPLLVAWDAQGRFLTDVVGQMTSYYLLPSMGLLLAMRCGVLDLSVWVSMALGGVVTAVLLSRGGPQTVSFGHGVWAMLGGVGAGAALGLVNALFACRSRLPGTLVTLVTAVAVMFGLQWLLGARELNIPDSSFASWHLRQHSVLREGATDPQLVLGLDLPLLVTRMLVVAGLYGLTMLVMLVVSSHVPSLARRHGWTLPASLVASGALAAAGGVCWLLENPTAPVPTRPIGDLRVLAAAVLAGGWLLAGHGRTLLACICLPPAFLLATIWWQRVWGLDYLGYAPQVLILAAGALLTQHSWRLVMERRPWRAFIMPAALPLAGMLLLALAAVVDCLAQAPPGPSSSVLPADSAHVVKEVLRWTALACLLAGAVVLAWAWRRERRGPLPG